MGVPYKDVSILVVEDQRPFLVLLKGLLTNLGAKDVMMATQADHALKYCRNHKIDIVVCDLHLGSNKKNGYELYQELMHRKLLAPTSVFLLISADAARPVVLGSLEHNPDDYLLKPFSQAQIKNRLNKAWKKNQFFHDVYNALSDEQYSVAHTLLESMDVPAVYYRESIHLKVEVFWAQRKYAEAISLLQSETALLPSQWAQLALGKSYLAKREFQLAIKCAAKVLELNRYDPDAHDIIAQAKSALHFPEEAMENMRLALKYSPYSLARQQLASQIALKNGDFPLLVESSLATWQLSKNTIFKRISYWCNHIGFLLDAAEAAENKAQRHRYQQEALLQVQRALQDDAILRLDEPFDIDIFTDIVSARVDVIDGKLIDAKKTIMASQINIESRFTEYPASLAPGSIQTLLNLGEFEEVNRVLNTLKEEKTELDSGTRQLIAQYSEQAKDGEDKYTHINRRGIQLYQEEKYADAKEAFTTALGLAPVNTGIALNLLQCQVKLFGQANKLDPLLVKEARQVYKIVNNAPMREQHQSKFENLQDELIRLGVTTR
ncbi:response regulator [Marisediminitalea sp.]|uniref:response regulator n=1 Tax=Marisediminitalea sp. TaxID=2662268 RepID=UPI003375526E|nr:response regulator [Aestuariibacter sp.]MCP5012075.1 response regulator [Aestuariibacter sp.]